MLTEYFPPFDFGGTEWSTFYLARGLAKRKIEIIIATPNYANLKEKEFIEGFQVIRFPFYKKTKKQLSPFWQTNMLWIILTSLVTFWLCLRKKVDIIHVQGKYFLPAAIFTKLMLNIKVVVTLRDYIIICPLGLCLTRGDKGCNLVSYYFKDLSQYLRLYFPQKKFNQIITILTATRSRASSYFLAFLLKFADKKIAISNLVKKIYLNSGQKNIDVIYNPVDRVKSHAAKAINKSTIVFAGRLTPGKGVDLLIAAIPSVLRKMPKTQFIILGEGFLKEKLKANAKKLNINKNVKFKGQVSHQQVLKLLSSSSACVVPSRWPEPLSRTGIESLSVATPVVLSARCGNVEIFKNRRWGYIVKPTPQAVAKGLILALNNAQLLKNNLIKDLPAIGRLLGMKVVNDYAKIYREVLR